MVLPNWQFSLERKVTMESKYYDKRDAQPLVGNNNFAFHGRFYNQPTPYSTYAYGATFGFNNCVYGEIF